MTKSEKNVVLACTKKYVICWSNYSQAKEAAVTSEREAVVSDQLFKTDTARFESFAGSTTERASEALATSKKAVQEVEALDALANA